MIKPHGIDPFEVQVTLDERPLRTEEAGADVVVTENRSFFRAEEGRMYEVVALSAFSDHELQMNLKSARLALFAMTSGADA